MPRWAKFLFMGIGTLVMVLSIWWFVHASQRAAAAADWPVAEGRAVANRVETRESTDDDGDRVTDYDAIVTFEYAVNGRRYRSERLFLNEHELFSSDFDAREFLRQYRPGTALEVYYNPDDPSDAAVNIDGPSWLILLIPLTGAAFFAAGWFFPADRPPRKRPPFGFRRG